LRKYSSASSTSLSLRFFTTSNDCGTGSFRGPEGCELADPVTVNTGQLSEGGTDLRTMNGNYIAGDEHGRDL